VRSGSQIDLRAREAAAAAAAAAVVAAAATEASPFIARRCTSSRRVPATKVIFLDRYRAFHVSSRRVA